MEEEGEAEGQVGVVDEEGFFEGVGGLSELAVDVVFVGAEEGEGFVGDFVFDGDGVGAEVEEGFDEGGPLGFDNGGNDWEADGEIVRGRFRVQEGRIAGFGERDKSLGF